MYNENSSTCVICLEEINTEENRNNKVLECGHMYHNDCIQDWLRTDSSCPLCRAKSNLITENSEVQVAYRLSVHRYIARLKTLQTVTFFDIILALFNLIYLKHVSNLIIANFVCACAGFIGTVSLNTCYIITYGLFRLLVFVMFNSALYYNIDILEKSTIEVQVTYGSYFIFLWLFYSYILYTTFVVTRDIRKFRSRVTSFLI